MSTGKLNKDGLLKSAPATIYTYGGGTIEPLNPDPEDITIEAIAHALALQCRWTGHTTRRYSVAEHCVHVSRMVPKAQRLDALMHDASEAYLSDLARPIKHAPGLGSVYLEVERKLEEAIAVRFGTAPPPMSAEIKDADNAMLWREAKQLVPHLGVEMPDVPSGTPRVRCWDEYEAEYEFLQRYEDLA